MTTFLVGLDLGQSADFTALVLIERIGTDRYMVRHIERHRGMKYPDVVRLVAARLKPEYLYAQPADPDNQYHLVVDYTGVGRPVYDMLCEAGLRAIPLTITGGNQVTRDEESGAYRVPKRDLVSALQVTMQTGRLKFVKTLPGIETLVRELDNFKIKTTLAANDTYEAWREGDHDDFVLAMAGAIWYGETQTGEAAVESLNVIEYHIGGNSEF